MSIEAHNFLFDIKVKGDNVLRLANAMARLRTIVEQIEQHEQAGLETNSDIETEPCSTD